MPPMRRTVYIEDHDSDDVVRENGVPDYGTRLARIGDGPDWCSSSAGLAISPEICWDVCGYYALLGVTWTATKRELKEGALSHGGADDYQGNYAQRPLLDDDTPYFYYRVPLGGVFISPPGIPRMLERNAEKAPPGATARGGPPPGPDA